MLEKGGIYCGTGVPFARFVRAGRGRGAGFQPVGELRSRYRDGRRSERSSQAAQNESAESRARFGSSHTSMAYGTRKNRRDGVRGNVRKGRRLIVYLSIGRRIAIDKFVNCFPAIEAGKGFCNRSRSNAEYA